MFGKAKLLLSAIGTHRSHESFLSKEALTTSRSTKQRVRGPMSKRSRVCVHRSRLTWISCFEKCEEIGDCLHRLQRPSADSAKTGRSSRSHETPRGEILK